jgi:5-methylcytosine-specific restriction protein A
VAGISGIGDGATCQVCKMSFKETYGSEFDGIIHVHHLIKLSNIGEKYNVDPINDLRPVCPNCHAAIHRKEEPFTIEELSAILNKRVAT